MPADLGMRRMKTTLCTRVGIEVPNIQAPMGGAVGPDLRLLIGRPFGCDSPRRPRLER